MIIKLKSENKYFLDILYKNPNTDQGLYLKELKDGIVVGNAISANEYDCVFLDSKHSYMPEDGSQIDFQSYCSPLLALNMGSEFFNHLYKEKASLEETVISWLDKPTKKSILKKRLSKSRLSLSIRDGTKTALIFCRNILTESRRRQEWEITMN